MDHDQQTCTTDTSAEGEYRQYCSIVAEDALLRDHVTLANTYNSGRYKTWAAKTFI